MEESLTNNQKVVRLVLMIALPIAVGIGSAAITGDSMIHYNRLFLPRFAPPGRVFPSVWTVLYIMMGIGSYFLLTANVETEQQVNDRHSALIIYFIHLGFNFAWSLFFFIGELYLFSFFWLIAMWLMIVAIVVKASRVCARATAMFVPYLLWCTFAAYLNVMISIMN